MKPSKYWDTSSHLRPSICTDERNALVTKAVDVLTRSGLGIDLLVVTGVSGTVFGTSLADALGLPLAIVRKVEQPEAHSGRRVEGPDRCDPIKNWLFVDDLISTGRTYRRVIASMAAQYHSYAKHVGIFLYGECQSCYGFNEAHVDAPIYGPDGPIQWHRWWDDPMRLQPKPGTFVEVVPDKP